MAHSADDVATLGLAPLVSAVSAFDWESLVPNSSGSDLKPLAETSSTVASAAYAVRESANRLNAIETQNLLPQIATPIVLAREQLNEVTQALDTAADVSRLAPAMLGNEQTRRYLLLIQNNAESRASGGIPGALAIVSIDDGKLTLEAQSSATALGSFTPALVVEEEQLRIYSSRMGKFMQDVNFTPDFPTTAALAKDMWESKMGGTLDGVISIDPVALSYVLDATGPIPIDDPELQELSGGKLPREVTSTNLVPTLLSDVYAKISEPELQDVYFAGVAQSIFASLSSGTTDPGKLTEGISRGADEGRVLLWSAKSDEQAIIANYRLSGSVTGLSNSPAQFGVYFNDGTGAKMDYYVRRTVQLVKECAKDGYEQTSVRITSTNTAPKDAATSLPPYVTGDGIYGVSPGSVQTNVVAYGPVQANVETAKLDGQRVAFAPYLHRDRPVGVLTVRLAPGESKSVEFTFGKIVQQTEPEVFVTPSLQPLADVILPTETPGCH
ncbi:DUF4012 domain-containing protein [Arthrobacter sp. Z4-13]